MNGSPQRFYPVAAPDIGEREEQYVTDAIRSGWVSSLGPYIQRFESSFASYCDVAHGIATSNGTTALHLALVSLGIGPGDEVICPTLTFVATANAVRYTGATPVLVDVDEESWCIDPRAVERALSPSTRAVVAVHLYGHPADMDVLCSIVGTRDIAVIEDAAEAHGAEYRGKRTGGLGRMGVFSFYGNKLLTTGEGGMIVTDDPVLAERARFLRDHAMDAHVKYWHTEVGYNYRMTNVQAALGVAQLERLDEFLERKRRMMQLYRQFLAGELTLNPELPWAESSFWLACALLPPGRDRDDATQRLREAGIDTRPFFYPLHLLPPYAGTQCISAGADIVAERIASRGINLPSSVSHSEDIEYISRNLLAVLASSKTVV